jgi:hypothetical protein
MHKPTRLLIALAPVLLAACYDDNHFPYGSGPGSAPQGPQASLQVVHGSPDAPPVNVLIDGSVAIPNLDYAQGTGEQQVAAGTHTIEIQALTPGSPTTLIGPTTVTLVADTDYVFAAEGPVASISEQTYSHPLALVGPNTTQLQFVHAAPNAPSVAVYVTAPGADLSTSTPFGTASFQGAVGPTQIAAGQYEIRITAAGTLSRVLFDSGTITLGGGSDLVFSALQNEGPGTATIFLGVVDALGNDSSLFDVSTPTNVRFINDSPNAPALSLVANGNTATPLVPTLAYAAFSPYDSLTAGITTIAITAASNTSSSVTSQSLDLDAGSVHSIYAVGDLSGLQPFITRDHDRRYATQAKLRFIDGSQSAGLVDVYLTAPGTSIASVEPTYAGVAFLNDTGFVSYAAATYDLSLTPAGSKTPSVGPIAVTVINAGIYTIVLRDNAGGGMPPGVIYLDDFNGSP